MRRSSRRGPVLLATLVVALVTVVGLAWEPLYWWAMTERVEFDDYTIRRGGVDYHGRAVVYARRGSAGRDGHHGSSVDYYGHNGFLASESQFRYGMGRRMTFWNPDGTISHQWRSRFDDDNIGEQKHSPPWWWGATEQTAPSDPQWSTGPGK